MSSKQHFAEAQQILVGGVNSPVRAFKAVGGHPIFFKKGQGAYLYSEEGDRYIDYVLSFGPLILGHAYPKVIKAIIETSQNGTSFGAPCILETTLAKLIQEHYPSMEKIRFVNSGTEAAMSAIRLARAVTKRPYIIKFNGCYHGHVDSLLVGAGSGALTFAVPDSDGITTDSASNSIVLNYNDTAALKRTFEQLGSSIATVIVEPICGNMGVVLPKYEFLHTLRQCCSEHGALLIFDEVMCGFRVPHSSAQAYFNIKADITLLGKIIGGGLPCGAYGGSKEIMAHVSPEGAVYQAGTLSGSPLVMAAGIETLKKLKEPTLLTTVFERTSTLVEGLNSLLKSHKLPYCVQHIGSMFSLFLTKGPIMDLNDVKTCNLGGFSVFYQSCLSEKLYFAPSQFEANFMSLAHSTGDIEQTLSGLDKSLHVLKSA